jgi:hypothetical protein
MKLQNPLSDDSNPFINTLLGVFTRGLRRASSSDSGDGARHGLSQRQARELAGLGRFTLRYRCTPFVCSVHMGEECEVEVDGLGFVRQSSLSARTRPFPDYAPADSIPDCLRASKTHRDTTDS